MQRPRLRFTIRRLMDLVAVAAVALAMLRFIAVETWSVIISSLTLAALGAAVLGVRFHRRRVRAFCLGAALAGGAWFFWSASPTFARGAGDPHRRIAQSLVTVSVAAAGGSAASFSYGCRLLSPMGLAALPFRGPQVPRSDGNRRAAQATPPIPVTKEVRAVADGRPLCLAISPDGKTLAAGCADRLVKLLDARTGQKRAALAGVTRGYLRGVAFTPDGKAVAAVSDDQQLRLWDVASGRMIKAIPAPGELEQVGLPPVSPMALAVSPDGSLIAVGGGGTTDPAHVLRMDETTFFVIRVLDVKTGHVVWSHIGRRGFMDQLAFSPDGKTLASANRNEIQLRDARRGDLVQRLKPQVGSVWALAFSPDHQLLAGCGTAFVDGRRGTWLTLWDRRSGAVVRATEAGEAAGATTPGALAFSPDGKTLASAGNGIVAGRISIGGREVGRGQKVVNFIKLWDVATGTLVWTSAEGDVGLATSLVFAPDGGAIFCCDQSAVSRIDARTGQTRQDVLKTNEDGAR